MTFYFLFLSSSKGPLTSYIFAPYFFCFYKILRHCWWKHNGTTTLFEVCAEVFPPFLLKKNIFLYKEMAFHVKKLPTPDIETFAQFFLSNCIFCANQPHGWLLHFYSVLGYWILQPLVLVSLIVTSLTSLLDCLGSFLGQPFISTVWMAPTGTFKDLVICVVLLYPLFWFTSNLYAMLLSIFTTVLLM